MGYPLTCVEGALGVATRQHSLSQVPGLGDSPTHLLNATLNAPVDPYLSGSLRYSSRDDSRWSFLTTGPRLPHDRTARMPDRGEPAPLR